MVFTEEDELVISKRNQTLWSKTFSVAVPYKAVVRFIKSWTEDVDELREQIKAVWEELE